MCQQRLFEIKETLRHNSLISRLVLEQESWNNWPNCPEARPDCKHINLTQKETIVRLSPKSKVKF